ncbi:MAG: Acyl-CoA dehydrogenase, partial [uncultured Acidimicrobiales bacterium]
ACKPVERRRLRGRAVQPRHVRGCPPVAGGGQDLHPRGGAAHERGVLRPGRRPRGPLGLRPRTARAARGGQGQGEGQRPLELLPAERRDGPGSQQPRLRVHRGRARQEPARLGVPQLRRTRHRQHGGARARRDARAEEAVARAAPGRGDPVGVRHDRAGPRFLRCEEHLDLGRARRRGVGHQRREVLHLGCRRPPLQDHDRHGQDEPRGLGPPAAVADPRAAAAPRGGGPRADARLRQGRRAPRPHAPALHRRPGPEGEHPPGRGQRLRDLAAPARPRAHPPLHALDRGGREGAPAHGGAGPQPGGVRQAAREPRRQHRDHLPRPHRDRGDAPDGPQGGQGHGPHGQRRGQGVGQRGQGDGARAGLPDHRPGDPDARRHRCLGLDTARGHVHLAADAAPRRRPRRGPPHGRRPGRDRQVPAAGASL